MDEVVRKVAALGLPGVLLVVTMAATGLAGGAAITTALAALGGPFGMIGGIAALGVAGLVGYEHEEEKIKDRYKFLYKYLSNFVHVSPYSISQHSHLISIDELKKIVLPIVFYLNIANNDILDDFPDLEEELQVKINYPEIFQGLDEFIKWLRAARLLTALERAKTRTLKPQSINELRQELEIDL